MMASLLVYLWPHHVGKGSWTHSYIIRFSPFLDPQLWIYYSSVSFGLHQTYVTVNCPCPLLLTSLHWQVHVVRAIGPGYTTPNLVHYVFLWLPNHVGSQIAKLTLLGSDVKYDRIEFLVSGGCVNDNTHMSSIREVFQYKALVYWSPCSFSVWKPGSHTVNFSCELDPRPMPGTLPFIRIFVCLSCLIVRS